MSKRRRSRKTLYKRLTDELHGFKVNAQRSDKSRNDLKSEIGFVQREYVWSNNSYKSALRAIKQFDKYIKEHRPDLRRAEMEDVTMDDIGEYLKYRQDVLNLSPETVSNDMWALNKVFGYKLTKKEYGLASRYASDVINNRDVDGDKIGYDDLSDMQKQLIDVSRAFGLRRNEYKDFTSKSLFTDSSGSLFIYLGPSTKGGKVRVAKCTDEMKDVMEERYGEHFQHVKHISSLPTDKHSWRELTDGGQPLERTSFAHDVPIHRVGRQYYAGRLLVEIESKGVLFPESYLDKQNRTKSGISTYTTNGITMNRAHAQYVSKNLGHNRIDVLSRYIF